MDESPVGFETLVKTPVRAECSESRLVLTSVGIPNRVVFRDGLWMLFVRDEHAARARAELRAFHEENPVEAPDQTAPLPAFEGATAGVLVYAITLALVALYTAHRTYGLEWLEAGQMQSGQVLSGQWWRIVTALTLHLDAGHIGSNLVFGSVFGLLAGRAFGGGVAWLTIVVAGSLGNLANALVQPATHTSIGASTAVFAALGLLVAHALRNRGPARRERALRRWSPLIGGVVLLAMTGVGGERTDVMAHVTGFLAGLVVSLLVTFIPLALLGRPAVQRTTGVAALLIVLGAWIVGLAAAG
ncbi:rhomboid family intramembrane serine protease [Roseimaritima sediminicola]|uniref:rhomboid family intramembrane serine protease n=1 Tax=Roseimaritima sediminicola TaxID=2662066 RepID=UPI00129854F3|nr:rhomboid family intramembrane serine protease [Roseimaritima sediminicola]